MDRACRRCQASKPEDAFPRRSNGVLENTCKACRSATNKAQRHARGVVPRAHTAQLAGLSGEQRKMARKRLYRARQAMAQGRRPQRNSAYALHDAHVLVHQGRSAAQARKMERQAKEQHDSHVRRWRKACPSEAFNHRYRTDPAFNAKQKLRARLRKLSTLDGEMACYMSNTIKKRSMWKAWQELLGYTTAQLVAHLKRTLPKGASWDDFLEGRLHIDHITPRSAFDLTDIGEVQRCWCLSNLQLLHARDNLLKRDRIEVLL
jgi:hypothetical protein